MKIFITSITLENFKGIRHLDIHFEDDNIVSGANQTGKTTIADAVTWLFFGKDTKSRQQFGIKTRDRDGIEIPHLPHSVSAEILIDGVAHHLKRALVEQFTKVHGENREILKANTTECFIDGRKVPLRDYQQFISDIISEATFRVLSNPVTFPSLPWEEQRRMLTDICPPPSREQVAASLKADVQDITRLLDCLEQTTIELHRKHLAYMAKEVKNKLLTLPIRQQEVMATMPEQEKEWEAIEMLIADNEQLIAKAHDELAKQATSAAVRKLQKDIEFLERRKANIEISARDRAARSRNELERQTDELQHQIADVQRLMKAAEYEERTNAQILTRIQERKAAFEEQKQDIRAKWADVGRMQFIPDPLDTICPTCGQPLPQDKLTETFNKMKANFANRKANRYAELTRQADELKADIAQAEKMEAERVADVKKAQEALAQLREKLAALQEDFAKLKDAAPKTEDELLQADDNYCGIVAQIQEQHKRLLAEKEAQGEDFSQELQEEINLLMARKKSLIESNARKALFHDLQKRLEDIARQQQQLNAQLSDIERQQDLADDYQRQLDSMMEDSINNLFSYVRFRLFRTQVNGERLPYCEATVDGIPYSDLNTAARINAGLDIINTLSRHYDTFAPVIIDNAEAVNQLIQTQSQTIKFYVNEKKLSVNGKEI